MSINKYWHTLRHLRPIQIYGRIWFRLYRPRPDLRAAPELRSPTGVWQAPVACPPSMTGENTFRFLNEAFELVAPRDWNAPERDKLWLYNLHYFDDLNSVGAIDRVERHRALISRWIAENPPGFGNGWEPYPLSLRIINWIKWSLAGNNLEADWRHSLGVQIRFLTRRLEWHLLGNHLFANAKALVFAGLFFEGAEAEKWLRQGLEIMSQELPEQILADGGHFELSPMYHSIILEDMLDVINLARAYPKTVAALTGDDWIEAANRMRHWLMVVNHPDGHISFFNDAAFGIAPEPRHLEDYAGRLDLPQIEPLGDGISHLPASGYIRVQRDNMVALLDVARIGPDYIPGHAHADTLSFELSLHGQRLIVNSGTSQYGSGPERLRQRSTAAHNSVEVDGENSSEVWGGFRVARRARPIGLDIEEQQGSIVIGCGHHGYRRLPGKVTHRRIWKLSERSILLTDVLDGKYETAIARYHFQPELAVEIIGQAGEVILPSGQKIGWTVSGGNVELVESSWHPEFGKSIPNKCLEVRFSSGNCSIEFDW